MGLLCMAFVVENDVRDLGDSTRAEVIAQGSKWSPRDRRKLEMIWWYMGIR